MLTIKAPAKINLFLEVTQKRRDGFHNLESVFQTVPLFDTLEASESEILSLEVDNPNIPTDTTNLILKAALRLREICGIKHGAHFKLAKKIPSAGGLGGGSSDAAAALILANKLWHLKLSKNDLANIGSEIGSDVPFFIYGGVCLCEGRGEIITEFTDIQPLPVSIIGTDWGISTPKAFSLLDSNKFGVKKVANFIDVLKRNPTCIQEIYNQSFNHFEEVVFKFKPRQRALHETLSANNVMPRMSGSGSSVWLLNPQKGLDAKLPEGCKIIL